MSESRSEVTDRRLNYYRERMRTEGGTPVFCIGVTTGSPRRAICCLPDDLPLEDVRNFVREVLRLLDAELGD
jgi:hypothetical protein